MWGVKHCAWVSVEDGVPVLKLANNDDWYYKQTFESLDEIKVFRDYFAEMAIQYVEFSHFVEQNNVTDEMLQVVNWIGHEYSPAPWPEGIRDAKDRGFIEFVKNSGDYILTDKGKQLWHLANREEDPCYA